MKNKSTRIKIAVSCAAFALAFAARAEIQAADRTESDRITSVLTDMRGGEREFAGMPYSEKRDFFEKVVSASRKMPGSAEHRAAKTLNAAVSFTRSCSGDETARAMSDIITVSPYEALPSIVERFSTTFLKRPADGVSDGKFSSLAAKIVGGTAENAGREDRVARRSFAAVMMLKADGGRTPGLKESLVRLVDPDEAVRAEVSNKWIPAALSDEKSFDGILEYADSGKAPNLDIVLTLTGPQMLDCLLVDMTAGISDGNGVQTTPFVDQAFGGFDEAGIYMQTMRDSTSATSGGEVPKSNADVPWNPEYGRGEKPGRNIFSEPEPEPYPFCTM